MEIIYSELILRRRSKRTYDGRPLSQEDKIQMIDFIEQMDNKPFGLKTHFDIIEKGNMGEKKIKLGTYGFIKGTNSFITARSNQADFSLETLGYQMEKVILHATALNLGTCWLGGTFNRGTFANAIELENDEILPIASPIGYALDKLRFGEKIVRLSAGSDNRKPWNEIFFSEDF
ncbi:MAG: nitroreductase family protein, partial [Clostridiales bacterium]|nr:nitroreductase family protein [Clostridiales bacterium]